MQDLLLLLALFFLYHRLQPGGQQAGLADSSEEVMITNRYFQWVIQVQPSHGLTVAERIGGRPRTEYFQSPFLPYLGLNEEKWIFTDDGKIQNVGSGKFLSGPTVGTLVTLTASSSPGTWRMEEEHILHQPSQKVLTVYKDGSLHLEERKLLSRTSVPVHLSRSLGGVINKLLNIIDFVKV